MRMNRFRHPSANGRGAMGFLILSILSFAFGTLLPDAHGAGLTCMAGTWTGTYTGVLPYQAPVTVPLSITFTSDDGSAGNISWGSVSHFPFSASFTGSQLVIALASLQGDFVVTVTGTSLSGYVPANDLDPTVTVPQATIQATKNAGGPSCGLTITTTSLNPGYFQESDYGSPLSATGGTQPYRWVVTGLPNGLSVDASDNISGSFAKDAENIKTFDRINRKFQVSVSVTDSAVPPASAGPIPLTIPFTCGVWISSIRACGRLR